ncbi:MAG: hypothetical protein E7591_06935 [Ruminococcaceae bacterium]|nr:hypothetical protein [Oscillospiraceae bacterium]
MGRLKEYIFSLMIVSVSCAAVNMLAPDNSKLSKYVHFLVGLVVALAMLLPIQSIVRDMPLLFDEAVFEDKRSVITSLVDESELIIEESVSIMERELKEQIENRLSKKISNISIEYDAQDPENVIITKVRVEYDKSNRLLFSDTERYVEELLLCECEVGVAGE